jgi:hypothetical protein
MQAPLQRHFLVSQEKMLDKAAEGAYTSVCKVLDLDRWMAWKIRSA